MLDFCDALLQSARSLDPAARSEQRDATLDVFAAILAEVDPVPDALVELIKQHGMWVDKPDDVEDEAPVEAELAERIV